MVKFFEFFAIVPEIPSPKHHEIHEFGRNYHISAMKFSNFTYSAALLQVHNDNILVEQGCASIKKQTFY
jgi:hypothetical protein